MQYHHGALTLYRWDILEIYRAYGPFARWPRFAADWLAHRARAPGVPFMAGPLQLAEVLSFSAGGPLLTQRQAYGRWVCIRAALGRLYAVAGNIEAHYRRRTVPKAGGGTRTLCVPQAELRRFQDAIRRQILWALPVSPYAMAYVRGRGIADNARPHVGQAVVLKLDIRDFFGSITFDAVLRTAFPSTLFPPAVGVLLARLCCLENALPQGAPTSPALSNRVLYTFDLAMGAWCGRRGIAYTRYCDDLTFSGDFAPGYVIQKARALLAARGFCLKDGKTRVQRRRSRQSVTGVTVNERMRLAKPARRALRQAVYYCRRFGVEDHIRHCAGLARFVEDGATQPERYLRHLLGRVGHALHLDPADAEMARCHEQLIQMLAAFSEPLEAPLWYTGPK